LLLCQYLFLTESFGVIEKQSKEWLRDLLKEITRGDDKGYVQLKHKTYQRISIMMQNIRATQFFNIMKNYSLDYYPEFPWKNPPPHHGR
jgi:hypothetical protein